MPAFPNLCLCLLFSFLLIVTLSKISYPTRGITESVSPNETRPSSSLYFLSKSPKQTTPYYLSRRTQKEAILYNSLLVEWLQNKILCNDSRL
jgi:hypothetical protein